MMGRRGALVTAFCLLAACENADLPLTPAWGKQRCSHCAMVVGDKRFAAQAVTSREERLFFDDPGCLASYELEHASSLRHAWVLSDGQWLSTAAARFAAGARSPMDYGFEAKRDGTADWSQVKKAARELNVVGAR